MKHDAKHLWKCVNLALDDSETIIKFKRLRSSNLGYCYDNGLIEIDVQKCVLCSEIELLYLILHELFHRYDEMDTDEAWSSIPENTDYDDDNSDERASILLKQMTTRQYRILWSKVADCLGR